MEASRQTRLGKERHEFEGTMTLVTRLLGGLLTFYALTSIAQGITGNTGFAIDIGVCAAIIMVSLSFNIEPMLTE